MGQNSIRENLTKEDIIADIRLTLAADFEHKKSIVIVEGEDDVSFFNGKLASDVDLHESFSGKIGVEEIVNSFNDDRVIGIRDRDYDPISNNPRIYYYDYCCLEMMLIADDAAFSNYCYGYYRGTKKPLALREELLRDLESLSLYRKLSVEKGWSINFKGIDFSKAFDENTGKLKISSIIAQIKKINSADSELIRTQLSSIGIESQSLSAEADYYLITQGHDFIHYFHQVCLHSMPQKRNNPSAKEMYRSLVCSYRSSDLCNTEFHQKIVDYQSSVGRNVFAS